MKAETAPAPLPQKAAAETASPAEQEQRIRALLSRLALFADLDGAQLALLASATQRQTYVPGDVIARRG